MHSSSSPCLFSHRFSVNLTRFRFTIFVMTCENIQSSSASASCRLDATHQSSPFCVHRQLLSRRTVIRVCLTTRETRTFLDRFHWVIYLQHLLVAFVNSRVWPSTVLAVSVSSCIVPTIISDPARVSKHELLTVSTGVKIILSDLGSTCNVLLSPAVLTLLVDWDHYFTVLITQSLVVTLAQFVTRTLHWDLAHSTRSRSSTGRLHSHLGNSLPRTETASLWSHVDDHIRLVLGRYVQVLLPDFVVGFHTFLRVLLACCWHCSFFCSRVLRSRSLAVFA